MAVAQVVRRSGAQEGQFGAVFGPPCKDSDEVVIPSFSLDSQSPGETDPTVRTGAPFNPREQALCSASRRYDFPRRGRAADGRYRYIVNTEEFPQGITIIKCSRRAIGTAVNAAVYSHSCRSCLPSPSSPSCREVLQVQRAGGPVPARHRVQAEVLRAPDAGADGRRRGHLRGELPGPLRVRLQHPRRRRLLALNSHTCCSVHSDVPNVIKCVKFLVFAYPTKLGSLEPHRRH